MGKYGLSMGDGDGGVGAPGRYLRLGENSLITSGHTRSLRRKLNSGCCSGVVK